MVDLNLYLAFLLASAVLIVIPGPNVTLIVANSVAYGARSALVTVAGTQSAQALQLTAVVLGMSSLIALFATWFEWLRWLGVAYLLWLGVQRWRARAQAEADAPTPAASARALFWQGFLVAATNPKVLFFYAAFFPQFVDPSRPPVLQLIVLSLSFLLIALVLDGGYALLAGRLRSALRAPRGRRLADRIAGTLLIGTGLWLAFARRN